MTKIGDAAINEVNAYSRAKSGNKQLPGNLGVRMKGQKRRSAGGALAAGHRSMMPRWAALSSTATFPTSMVSVEYTTSESWGQSKKSVMSRTF